MVCAACGTAAARGSAKFCLVCGKSMLEGYEPLDSIRASYGLQRQRLQTATVVHGHTELFYDENKNSVAETAWACVVFAMVPYLGILFTPAGLVLGGIGYVAAKRNPTIGGRHLSLVSVGLSLLLFGFQIFLWWLLYIIPELNR